jgi:hypothetical protein
VSLCKKISKKQIAVALELRDHAMETFRRVEPELTKGPLLLDSPSYGLTLLYWPEHTHEFVDFNWLVVGPVGMRGAQFAGSLMQVIWDETGEGVLQFIPGEWEAALREGNGALRRARLERAEAAA